MRKRSMILRYMDEKSANKGINFHEKRGWDVYDIKPIENPNGAIWQSILIFVWFVKWEDEQHGE